MTLAAYKAEAGCGADSDDRGNENPAGIVFAYEFRFSLRSRPSFSFSFFLARFNYFCYFVASPSTLKSPHSGEIFARIGL